jgi:hypothetical protein
MQDNVQNSSPQWPRQLPGYQHWSDYPYNHWTKSGKISIRGLAIDDTKRQTHTIRRTRLRCFRELIRFLWASGSSLDQSHGGLEDLSHVTSCICRGSLKETLSSFECQIWLLEFAFRRILKKMRNWITPDFFETRHVREICRKEGHLGRS